jgi:hypothetical protein
MAVLLPVSRDAGKIKVIDEKGRLADGGLIKLIEEIVVERKIDLVALDPFVKTHSVGENDNSAIDAVAQLLTDLADKHNVGVDCPHHTRKGSHDPGNAQSGRGASALIDAGRLIKTLQPMSSDEAKAFGIPDEDRHGYVRVDKGKANILPPGRVAQWFKLVGVELGNATETYPSGDSVQTVEPWTPPDICAGLDVELQNIILDTIEAGLPNGARYSDASNASERAAWKVVRERCPDQAEGPSRELIKRWIRDGVLETREYEDTGQRKKRKGLYVNAARRPK